MLRLLTTILGILVACGIFALSLWLFLPVEKQIKTTAGESSIVIRDKAGNTIVLAVVYVPTDSTGRVGDEEQGYVMTTFEPRFFLNGEEIEPDNDWATEFTIDGRKYVHEWRYNWN